MKHLSKANREILELFIPKLRERTTDFFFLLNHPEKLRYIIDNAVIEEQYKWIREKFVIRLEKDKIHFKIRELIVLAEEIKEAPFLGVEVVNEADLFVILNYVANGVSLIKFLSPKLEEIEIEHLESWCIANNYSIIMNAGNLILEKK